MVPVLLGLVLTLNTAEQSISDLVRDLRSRSFTVRKHAEEKLAALDTSKLPELKKAHQGEQDLEAKRRLERIISVVEIRDARRRFSLRGDDISRHVFGPVDPGPVVGEVYLPVGTNWIDGVWVLMVLTNQGREAVNLRWDPGEGVGSTLELPRVSLREVGGTSSSTYHLSLKDLRLGPGEQWSHLYYLEFWSEQGFRNPELEFSLNLVVEREGKRGKLSLRSPGELGVRVRAATREEEKAVAQELLGLGKRGLTQAERARLNDLLVQPQRPQNRLSVSELQTVYKKQASDNPDFADHFFTALIHAAPEKDVLAFAEKQIRDGDMLPLSPCGRLLPRELADSAIKGLNAKHLLGRMRAIEFLGRVGGREVGEKLVALLEDEKMVIRASAVKALGEMKYPCGERLVKLLTDPDVAIAVHAGRALVEVATKEHIPALREALGKRNAYEVKAEIIRARVRLRASPDIVKPYLKADYLAMQSTAIRAYAMMGGDADDIAPFLVDHENWPAEAAIEGLGMLRSRRHLGQITVRYYELPVTVAEALARIGGKESAGYLTKLAFGETVHEARGYAEEAVVRALGKVLSDEERLPMMKRLAERTAGGMLAREEAIRQLGLLGRDGARHLQTLLGDQLLQDSVMRELMRHSAPRRFAEQKRFPSPLRGTCPLGELQERIGMPVRIGEEVKPGRTQVAFPGQVTLPELAVLVMQSNPDLGVILTDEEMRIVSRDKALQYYREMKLP